MTHFILPLNLRKQHNKVFPTNRSSYYTFEPIIRYYSSPIQTNQIAIIGRGSWKEEDRSWNVGVNN